MSITHIFESIMALSMVSMIGLYFIFSNTILRALSDSDSGDEVMVRINAIILNPFFFLLFFGSALSAVYFCIVKEGLDAYAGAIFFIGTFMVTVIKNVPLNNQLLNAGTAAERKDIWQQYYLTRWVWWNHVRTVSAMISGILILL